MKTVWSTISKTKSLFSRKITLKGKAFNNPLSKVDQTPI